MKRHAVAVGTIAALAAFAAAPAAVAQQASAQKPAPHKRTPWGAPDIAGVYAEFTIAPLERPVEFGEREYLSQDEFAQFEKQRLEDVDQDDETIPGTQADVHYDMGTFKLSQNEGVTSPNMRTSIVTTPKNGRIPPLTPAAAARRDAR
ncbi:MAG TPA: hypothetical protein VFO94_13015, partial [Gammaproteobacteria bacterium]|nr:hypothetical protein [Gammaproteobacteria bacterium]